jgi:hypothetical protein
MYILPNSRLILCGKDVEIESSQHAKTDGVLMVIESIQKWVVTKQEPGCMRIKPIPSGNLT